MDGTNEDEVHFIVTDADTSLEPACSIADGESDNGACTFLVTRATRPILVRHRWKLLSHAVTTHRPAGHRRRQHRCSNNGSGFLERSRATFEGH